jgi:hypothetical protein
MMLDRRLEILVLKVEGGSTRGCYMFYVGYDETS